MSVQRQAQAFYLSSELQTANTKPFTISATSALDLLLDSFYCNCTVETQDKAALVTAMTISGQSLFASDKGFPLVGFLSDNNFAIEGINALGLTIATNQVFSITVDHTFNTALAPANPFGFSISTAPTDVTVSPNESGSLLNYVYGLGVVEVAAAGESTLEGVSLRDDVFLGRLIMDCNNANKGLIQITSIKVDGIELLSAQTPAIAPTLLHQFIPSSNDKSGLQLNYLVRQNSRVSITVKNVDPANPIKVAAGIYCKAI